MSITLETLLTTIPKSVNEFVFIIALIGLGIYIKKKKCHGLFLLLSVLFMIGWRSFIHIKSSRYACGLVLPFALLAGYFVALLTKCKRPSTNFLVFSIACMALFLWGKKTYYVSQINSNLFAISELHDLICRKDYNAKLITKNDDALRIQRKEKDNHRIETYRKQVDSEGLIKFIMSYREINQIALFDQIVSRQNSSFVHNKINSRNNYRQIMSVFSQKNKKKKHNIYAIMAKANVSVISNNKMIPPQSGILSNGDLEIVDTPEASQKKFKVHIRDYYLYNDYNPSILTPNNAYFHNDPRVTQYLPFYNCSNEMPISGTYSAFIATKKGKGYLLFYQKFKNGNYNYSLILRGEKGTRVSLICDENRSSKWIVTNLGTFTIPDKRIFRITLSFEETGLLNNDFFYIGAYVENGSAQLDNFFINETTK